MRPAVKEWLGRSFPGTSLMVAVLLLALAARLLGGLIFERVVTVLLINLMLVLGLQMFMGNSGLVPFGHIAFMHIGAYSSIWFTLSPEKKSLALPDMPTHWLLYQIQLPFLPGVLMAVLITTLVAAVIGVPMVRLRGAAFSIATFAVLVIVHVVSINWDELTRGPRTVFGVAKFTTLWVAAVAAAATVGFTYLIKERALGLKLRASRDDASAAASVGVNLAWVRWVSFTLSAAVTGAAGALWAHFIGSFAASNFWLKETFTVIAMLIIGGQASVAGAVAGAAGVSLFAEALRRVEVAANLSGLFASTVVGFTEITLAIATILILAFRPSGLTRGRELRWPFGPKPGAAAMQPRRAKVAEQD